jgi:hypothetical protein
LCPIKPERERTKQHRRQQALRKSGQELEGQVQERTTELDAQGKLQ